MDIRKDLQQVADRTWDFADTLLRVANLSLFVTCMIPDFDKEVRAFQTGWAGVEPNPTSRAPFFGPAKAFELLGAWLESNGTLPHDAHRHGTRAGLHGRRSARA